MTRKRLVVAGKIANPPIARLMNFRAVEVEHGRCVFAGAPNATTNAVACAPIASMSAAFCAMALRPTSCGVDQSSRKCRPATSMSVDTTVLPSPAATTAASSPGPSTTVAG